MSGSWDQQGQNTRSWIVRVKFTNPDEFIEEVRERGPNVEPVLRATFRRTPDETGAPFHHLSVVATYLRRIAADIVAVIELRRYVGPVWSGVDDQESRRRCERAGQVLRAIENASRAAGYTPAAGIYLSDAGAAPNGESGNGPPLADAFAGLP